MSLCVVQDPKGSEVIWVRDCEEVVRLDGLTEVDVNSAQDLLQVHRRGSALRHTGKTHSIWSDQQTLFHLKYDDQSDLRLL